jgi:RES domain-containing protein
MTTTSIIMPMTHTHAEHPSRFNDRALKRLYLAHDLMDEVIKSGMATDKDREVSRKIFQSIAELEGVKLAQVEPSG